ncbi:hypothetical protein BV25DRAFT_1451010 [Artomyces pyxidatus]|uniref:Uncharacterized protein n=1 Tax=Artomyces pyxidatus TaxID=48021 RepID=A0ACB8SLY8_9AGAM|nr:hypothetical protein BV25DRAFT_1451010 [Artomyces pyxidatus]
MSLRGRQACPACAFLLGDPAVRRLRMLVAFCVNSAGARSGRAICKAASRKLRRLFSRAAAVPCQLPAVLHTHDDTARAEPRFQADLVVPRCSTRYPLRSPDKRGPRSSRNFKIAVSVKTVRPQNQTASRSESNLGQYMYESTTYTSECEDNSSTCENEHTALQKK